MAIMYCANPDHDVLINVPAGAPPFCCEDCQTNPTEPCPCEDVDAPHAGNMPGYSKAGGKSSGSK